MADVSAVRSLASALRDSDSGKHKGRLDHCVLFSSTGALDVSGGVFSATRYTGENAFFCVRRGSHTEYQPDPHNARIRVIYGLGFRV